jgi:hypothetical protein
MALEGNPGGRRRKSRPRKRWLDDVQDDKIKMSVKRWRTETMYRKNGGEHVRRPRFFKNCSATENKKKKKKESEMLFRK